jgi:hypothetical protein
MSLLSHDINFELPPNRDISIWGGTGFALISIWSGYITDNPVSGVFVGIILFIIFYYYFLISVSITFTNKDQILIFENENLAVHPLEEILRIEVDFTTSCETLKIIFTDGSTSIEIPSHYKNYPLLKSRFTSERFEPITVIRAP